MNLAKKVPRKDKVSYESAELQKFVADWAKTEGWEVGEFSTFLELAGIKTPVKLSGFDKDKCEFLCRAENAKVYDVRLYSGDGFDFPSEFITDDGEIKISYEIGTNIGQTSEPTLIITSKSARIGTKEMIKYFYGDTSSVVFKEDGNEVLKVEVRGEKVEEFTTFNPDEIMHINRITGAWNYISSKVSISFNGEKYSISIKAKEEEIKALDFFQILANVKSKIAKYM